MKKLVVVASVLGCAAIAMAVSVPSQNSVGYVKEVTPAANGINILSLNIVGEGNTVDIQDAIANTGDLNASKAANAGGNVANADKIYVYNGSSYTSYGLYDTGSSVYWMITTSGGWNKAAQASPSTQAITRGSSVWYQTGAGQSASEVMTLGQVPNDTTYNVNVGNLSLVAYPYASTINLLDLVVSNAASSKAANAGGNVANADKIYVYNGSSYTSYGLYDTGSSTYWMITTSGGWNKAAQAAPSDADLDLGKGVWYQSVTGSKTIGFTQNYNLD